MTHLMATGFPRNGASMANSMGYLIVGHGTRNEIGQNQVRELFGQITRNSGPACLPAESSALAFLELAEPDIPAAMAQLHQHGVRDLVVVPILLFSAGHAQHDIPNVVQAACDQYGMRILRQSRSLGCDPNILALSARRFQEALDCTFTGGIQESQSDYGFRVGRSSETDRSNSDGFGRPADIPTRDCPAKTRPACIGSQPSCPSCVVDVTGARLTGTRVLESRSGKNADHAPIPDCSQVGLAMIGRGSNSASATADMLEFAEKRIRMTPVAWSTTGFIHAQRPSVDEALDGLAATGLPYLVVQPHIIFEGELINDLRREIAYRQTFSKSQRWIITESLGADSQLANAICRLASVANH